MNQSHSLTPRATIQDIDPRGIRLLIVQIVFLVLVWILVSLRGLVRLFVLKRVALDDLFMFISTLIYTAHATTTIWGIVYASNEAPADSPEAESIALRAWFLCEVIYAPLSALIRTSIALFLLRIVISRIQRYFIYANFVVIWILSTVYFFILLLQCSPVSYFYEQALEKPGSCVSLDIVPRATIAHSVVSAVIDIGLALLPIAILWHVRLNKRTKYGIALLLSMGLLAGIALIVRIPYVKFTSITSREFLDQTNTAALWSLMEISLGIMAGCAATLRPLTWGFGSKKFKPPRFRFRHTNRGIRTPDRGMSWGLESDETHSDALTPEGRIARTLYEAYNTDVEIVREPKNEDDHQSTQISPSSRGRDSPRVPPSSSCRRDSPRRSWETMGLGRDSRDNDSPTSIRIQTSIEIIRELQPASRPGTPARSFPLLQPERVVAINGPTKQGVSTHTT
ncbi:integral membrane protein [Podospora didyma]|uniref:Integral membrane protein n=1 Tax=Podospora didyma TaxID=330526 RepID=A0AAE0P7I7_9PEZI|nr:integral membrane protein [Podospora didyma]